jgi:hypothetical protein
VVFAYSYKHRIYLLRPPFYDIVLQAKEKNGRKKWEKNEVKWQYGEIFRRGEQKRKIHTHANKPA